MNEAHLRQQLRNSPRDIRTRLQLSQLLVAHSRFADAERVLAEGVDLAPDHGPLLYAHGESLLDLNQIEAAVACFRQVCALQQCLPDVWVSLGGALLRQGQFSEAASLLERAAEALTKDPLVHQLHGEALSGCERTDDALEAYLRAWQLGFRDRSVAFYCGSLLCERHQYAFAVQIIEAGLELAGNTPVPWHNLGKAWFELGDVAAACQAFERGIDAGDGSALRELAVVIPGNPAATPDDILRIRRSYASSLQLASADWHPLPRSASPNRPLRVGYLSSFFAFANYMKPVYAILSSHNSAQVEVELFHDGPPSEELERCVTDSAVTMVFDVSELTNEALVAAIRERDLDVLVDLNAYSAVWRLPVLTLPLARITVGWFNHYATSGFPALAAILGDRHCFQPWEQAQYGEALIALPLSYLAFRVEHPAPAIVPPPSICGKGLTFGSLCSQYKITPQVLAAWAEILASAPTSRLLLANRTLESPDVRAYVLGFFTSAGISAERLDFRGGAPHAEYLTNYNEIDVALDAWPYNGGTTTTEALWQGVPVLCFRGDRWASRTSASIVAESPFADFLFDSERAMLDRAIAIANDPDFPRQLGERRLTARELLRGAPVCDVPRLAASLEQAYALLLRDFANHHIR